MPLYIRDDSVDALAVHFMKLTGAKSKTESVRNALITQTESEANRKSLLDRLAPLLKRADGVGEANPDFGMKTFTDEVWEEA